jgi:hypothetical protein
LRFSFYQAACAKNAKGRFVASESASEEMKALCIREANCRRIIKREQQKALAKRNIVLLQKTRITLLQTRKRKKELLGPELLSDQLKQVLLAPGSPDEVWKKLLQLKASCKNAVNNQGKKPEAMRNNAFLHDARSTLQQIKTEMKKIQSKSLSESQTEHDATGNMEDGKWCEEDDGREQAHRPRKGIKQYQIGPLDLRFAEHLLKKGHTFKDPATVEELMENLRKGEGSMAITSYTLGEDGEGRFYSEWPSPLHVNRCFRAVILILQKDCYTDLDMRKAHVNICLCFAQDLGIEVPFIKGTPSFMPKLQEHMQKKGFQEGDVKALILRYLNFGQWANWLTEVQKSENKGSCSIACRRLNKDAFEPWVKDHLKGLAADVKRLSQTLEEHGSQRWKNIFTEMKQRLPRTRSSSSVLGNDQGKAHRRAWNRCLTSKENDVIKVLEQLINSGEGDNRKPGKDGEASNEDAPRIAMPAYDGLLIHHAPGAFDVESLLKAWGSKSMESFGYHFPIAVEQWWKALDKEILVKECFERGDWARPSSDAPEMEKDASASSETEEEAQPGLCKMTNPQVNMEGDKGQFDFHAANTRERHAWLHSLPEEID